jgi:hypothetical protein
VITPPVGRAWNHDTRLSPPNAGLHGRLILRCGLASRGAGVFAKKPLEQVGVGPNWAGSESDNKPRHPGEARAEPRAPHNLNVRHYRASNTPQLDSTLIWLYLLAEGRGSLPRPALAAMQATSRGRRAFCRAAGRKGRPFSLLDKSKGLILSANPAFALPSLRHTRSALAEILALRDAAALRSGALDATKNRASDSPLFNPWQ